MDKSLKLTSTIHLDADPGKVWHALTDKDLIKQYFFGSETETDWKAGSPITWSGVYEGISYQDKGVILESEKDKLFKHTYWSSMGGTEDASENYATITYLLDSSESGTMLTVTQEGFNSQQAYDHSIQGWKEVLNNLKELVEK